MKNKLMLTALLGLLLVGSFSYAEENDDAAKKRLLKEYEKVQKEREKEAERAAKEAEEVAKRQAEEETQSVQDIASQTTENAEVVEVVEAPAEAVVATEDLNPQDEKEAMEILDGMRKKIKKEDAETLKLQQEAKELGISTSEASSLAEIEAMVKAKKAEKAKPKTEAEKLEATRKEALEKLDFYERVVRSVAREEAEVAGYYQIMDEDIKTTEAIEEAAPVVEPVQQ